MRRLRVAPRATWPRRSVAITCQRWMPSRTGAGGVKRVVAGRAERLAVEQHRVGDAAPDVERPGPGELRQRRAPPARRRRADRVARARGRRRRARGAGPSAPSWTKTIGRVAGARRRRRRARGGVDRTERRVRQQRRRARRAAAARARCRPPAGARAPRRRRSPRPASQAATPSKFSAKPATGLRAGTPAALPSDARGRHGVVLDDRGQHAPPGASTVRMPCPRPLRPMRGTRGRRQRGAAVDRRRVVEGRAAQAARERARRTRRAGRRSPAGGRRPRRSSSRPRRRCRACRPSRR